MYIAPHPPSFRHRKSPSVASAPKAISTETPQGLTPQQVEDSRKRYGSNLLTARKKKSFWRQFFSNLGDPIIRILLAALALNLLFSFWGGTDWYENAGIALAVFLATLISTLSEYSSESAFSRLTEECDKITCRILRRGQAHETACACELPIGEVVVGDTLLLEAGEMIPADGRLIKGRLLVDQSAMTGESREIEKSPAPPSDTPLSPGDTASLFRGCTVLSGQGVMQVSAVGDATFLGHISEEVQEDKRESPLKRRLSELAHQISHLGYVAAALVGIIYLINSFLFDSSFDTAVMLSKITDWRYVWQELFAALTLGLTVLVVAVPEGLPMMIAVVLSANIRRMVRDHVLVRKPEGLEAAGSMNILFTDKTGTLTTGKLTLSGVLTASCDYKSVHALARRAPMLFERIALAANANNGAVRGESDGGIAALGGNATDRALLRAFLPFPTPDFAVAESLPFDSATKFSAVRLANGLVLVTGAPDRLIPFAKHALGEGGERLTLSRAAFLARIRTRMAGGERLVLLCEGSEMPHGGACKELTVLCAMAFTDPLRAEAKHAVRTLQGAGVQVVMITGDSKETATGIATASGILSGDRVALEGSELARLSDEEVKALLPRLAVVARALPADKSRLVRLSESLGLVVGMTGDGINDAPALKLADVGFAMGSGTQVARDAGDIVILDDNLASVCRAVLYGRTIFKSIRKFITLQLVMNFCAVGISIIGPFIGFESPVTVVQMLWINIIMDTLGGLAFAGEAPLDYYMKERPKRREEPILTRALAGRIAYLSLCNVLLSVFFLTSPWVRAFYREGEGELCLLTAFFALFIFAAVFNCFNARTDRVRMLEGLSRNRAFLAIMALVAGVQIAFVYLGGAVLRTVPLTPRELLVTLELAALTLPLGLVHLIARRLNGKDGLY